MPDLRRTGPVVLYSWRLGMNGQATTPPIAEAIDTIPERGPDRGDTARQDVARANAAFRRRLYEHVPAESALSVLRELMLQAPDAETYQIRRDAFLRLCRDDTPPCATVAQLLRYFAVEVPELPFDDRDSLVHAILDHTEDEEALLLFLLAMTDQPDSVRPILDRIVSRQNPFPTLTRLLTAPWLESFRHILAAKLLDAARTRQGALRSWVREDPDTFFRPEVFNTLFGESTEVIGGICKEILSEGPPADRARLIERLRSDGSETALRILILGLPFGSRPCEPELLAAIASYDQPLAAVALSDVVHRSNVSGERLEDAIHAIKALGEMTVVEASSFLQSILGKRSAMMPMFRRPLRIGATHALKETETA